MGIWRSSFLSFLSALKVGSGANYTQFESDGTMVAKGNAHCFRDEYASLLIPASGAAAPDSVGATIGGVPRQLYSFDGNNTQEILSGSIEIPHDYMYGQPIEIHVHFRPSTANLGNVKWFFDYERSAVNMSGSLTPVLPVAKSTISAVAVIAAAGQYTHYVFSLGVLPDTNFVLGEKIGFNIRRTPNDAQDTYPDDVLLEQVAAHVPIDTLGSRQRYVK